MFCSRASCDLKIHRRRFTNDGFQFPMTSMRIHLRQQICLGRVDFDELVIFVPLCDNEKLTGVERYPPFGFECLLKKVLSVFI